MTRTDLAYTLPDGSKALRFDNIAFAAFEIHILKRENAAASYSEQEVKEAAEYYANMSSDDIENLIKTIIAGLPGAEEGYTLDQFRERLALYNNIDENQLRENLRYFLQKIVPVCEEENVVLAIHPDDLRAQF